MVDKHFKPKDVLDIFDIKNITKQSLLNYENSGEIPKANRDTKTKIPARFWTSDQLPTIGEKFGFLKQPKTPKIFTTYSQKGGGLKSSLTHTMARLLALHNIPTIVVGLDSQQSISRLLKAQEEIEDFNQLKHQQERGLYHLLFEGATIEDVIKKTDLATLDFIPETPELTFLERKLRSETTRKEYVFEDRLIPKLLKKGYKAIFFDCSPTWGALTEASITASQFVLNPIESYTGGYLVVDYNLKNIREFSEAMKQELSGLFLISTLTDSSKLSNQINAHYMNAYADIIVPYSIRRSVVGAECGFMNITPNEYNPTHALSEDYRKVISYIWEKALDTERTQ